MKVIFFSNSDSIYGANKSLLNLVFYLKEKGVIPLIICNASGPFTEYLEQHQLTYRINHFEFNHHENTTLSQIKTPLRFIRRLLPLKKLYPIVKEFAPDIIYTNSSNVSVGFFLSKLLNISHVWHIRESLSKHYNLNHDFGNRVHQIFIKHSDIIIANSHFISKELKFIDQGKLNVIYNGVFKKEALTSYESKSLDTTKKIVFGTTSIITPDKDQRQAILAFFDFLKINSKAELVIVGSGSTSYIQELKLLIKRLKIEGKVIFAGYVDDMKEVYSHINVLLVCSKHEAMGRVTAEAMAFGIPIIGHNSGGTAELVDNGVDGFLFDTQSELTERMIQLSQSENLYHKISFNARSKALELFTIEKYGESVWNLIKGFSSKRTSY